MPDPNIDFFCCDAHNDAYIAARQKSRTSGLGWTLEEISALDVIKAHLAELHNTAKGN